jgi:hypothetical protein
MSLTYSLRQIRRYMDICGVKEGWLVIFDARPIVRSNSVSDDDIWNRRINSETIPFPGGCLVHIIRC